MNELEQALLGRILHDLAHIKHQNERIMSQITEMRDAVEVSFAQVRTDLTAIQTAIAALVAQIAALQPDPADPTALDQVKADAAALATLADSVVPPVVPPALAADAKK
jgi:hypothetical protein